MGLHDRIKGAGSDNGVATSIAEVSNLAQSQERAKTADPYADLARVAPYAVTVQMKTEVYPAGKPQAADFTRLFGILRAAHYRGYVALEYEGREEPKEPVEA